MRKQSITMILSWFLGTALLAVPPLSAPATEITVIKEKPRAQQAGRCVVLKKDGVITDESESFYFKYPHHIQIGNDHSLYLLDEKQLLKLSPDGAFKFNFYKAGQGPGELARVSWYTVMEDNSVLIHNHAPNKMVHFDPAGKLLSETRMMVNKYVFPLFHVRGKLYYATETVLPTNGKGKMVPVDTHFNVYSFASKKQTRLETFPVENFILKTDRRYFKIELTQLMHKHFDGGYCVLSHTPEYLLKWVDLETGKIVKQVKRDYKRVPVTGNTKEYINGGYFTVGGVPYESPIPEYHNDIQALFMVEGKLLWVITSTVDEKKGVLVDVYDKQGGYCDYFYLKFPKKETHYKLEPGMFFVRDRLLCTIETTAEDNFVMVKYRLGFPADKIGIKGHTR